MTHIECTFMSEALSHEVTVTVLLPNFSALDASYKDYKFPVLYLLHGYSDCHSHWMRYTNIELYAEEKGLAVVMPSARNSFYVDMAHGMKYQTFVGTELPAKMQALFPISAAPEDNFIAGNSMGGYGTLVTVMHHPEKYAAAVSFSGVIDAASRDERDFGGDNVFGAPGAAVGGENDVLAMMKKYTENNTPLPEIYCICGTEDFLYQNNVKFRDFCAEIGAKIHYTECPGAHDWYFWDYHLKDVLGRLKIKKKV